MKIIKTEEIIEDGNTYVVNTYDNGTIEKYIKPDPTYVPPEPPQQLKPVTNEQLQAELQAIKDDNLALMMGVADLYAAVTSVNGGGV